MTYRAGTYPATVRCKVCGKRVKRRGLTKHMEKMHPPWKPGIELISFFPQYTGDPNGNTTC